MGLRGDRRLDHREHARLGAGADRGRRRTEARVAAAAPRRADPLLVRVVRARRRIRRRAHQDVRRAARRRVRPQRVEDVHHERRPGRVDGRLREDGSDEGPPRFVGVHRSDGRAGRHGREAPRQDGAAGDRHVRVLAARRRRSGSEPARRGRRRLQDRHADARLDTPRYGRGRRRASRRPPTSSRSTTRRSA